MMERIHEESSPLLPSDAIINIQPTPFEEINQAIFLLKRANNKQLVQNWLPILIGVVVASLSIAGIVIAAIPIDAERRTWGRWPKLMDEYNNYMGRDGANVTCGQIYPLKSLCDFKSIDISDWETKVMSGSLPEQFFFFATDCYFYARNRCLWPEEYGVDQRFWPAIVIVISCIGVLLGMGFTIYSLLTRHDSVVSNANESTRNYLREVSEKYSMNIPPNLTFQNAQTLLHQKAVEVCTSARRRAFLSASLPQYANQSQLHTFFKGDGKPFFDGKSMLTRAPREIQAMILDYAGLLPKTK